MMLGSPHTRANYRLFLSLGIVSLLLIGLLTGCSSTPGAPGHSFQGKLNLLQVPAPYSLPGQIVLGPDGNLWFPAIAYNNFTTARPSGAIGQLTPAGVFHMFPLPTPNSYPKEIAFGRDGKIWFSAFQGNGKLAPLGDIAPAFTGGHSELGQMSQDGSFHFFTLPSPADFPPAIAVGPDGNLWFTDVSSVLAPSGVYTNKIVHITASGAVSEFPLTLRKPTDFVSQLIAGPDGNLWFGIDSYLPDYSVFGEMGRMTPQGSLTIFTLGKFVEPRDMTIGPDSNLWFSAEGTIGRITMDGQLRVFTPNPQAQPMNRIAIGGIASNSDGALWFATQNVEIGRVATDGTFKLYPFPNNTDFDNGGSSLDLANLRGIVAGSDGTLWLTNDAKIGHFV